MSQATLDTRIDLERNCLLGIVHSRSVRDDIVDRRLKT
jgi:hypothetical protein